MWQINDAVAAKMRQWIQTRVFDDSRQLYFRIADIGPEKTRKAFARSQKHADHTDRFDVTQFLPVLVIQPGRDQTQKCGQGNR